MGQAYLGVLFVPAMILAALLAALYWADRASQDPSKARNRTSVNRAIETERAPPPPKPEIEPLPELPRNSIEPGDRLIYAFNHNPNRHIEVTISVAKHDPAAHLLSIGHPLIQAMRDARGGAGAREGDEVMIPAGGELRNATIVKIIKESVDGETQITDTPINSATV